MWVLLANLKHFYQRVALWSVYGGIGLMTCFAIWIHSYMTGLSAAAVVFPILMVFVLPVSQIVAVTQVEVLSRPFVFCLPGHQIAVRRLAFVAGLTVSLGALLMFPKDSVPSDRLMPALCSTYCAALAVYVAGISLVYVFALPGITVAVFGLFVVLTGYHSGLHRAVTDIIVYSPGPVVIAGVVSAVIMWLYLGHRPWFLPACRSRRAWLRSRWGPHYTSFERSALDEFILSRTRDGEHATAARHIWATLYACLSPRSPVCQRIGGAVAFALISTVVAWYSLPAGGFLICLAAMSAAERLSDTCLPMYSKFLTNGGRRERCISTMVLLTVLGGIMTLTVVVTFLSMSLFGPPLPKGLSFLHVEGEPMMNLRLALLLLIILPVESVLLALLREKGLPAQIAPALLAPPVFFLFLAVLEFEMMMIPASIVVVATLLSWFICANGIRRIAMRSDLVRR